MKQKAKTKNENFKTLKYIGVFILFSIFVTSVFSEGAFVIDEMFSPSNIFFFVNVTTGFVGIGTDSPSHKLEINGTLNMSGNRIVNVSEPLLASDAATKQYVDDSRPAEGMWRNVSGHATIVNGQVGIGTSSPEQRLDVNGTLIFKNDYIRSHIDTSRYTISINSGFPPVLNFISNSSTASYSGSVNLTWSAIKSLNCVAAGDWNGSKTFNGSEIITNIQANKIFNLTCTSNYGSHSIQRQVFVGDNPYNASSIFVFFRVNEDNQTDMDADAADRAVNNDGQSCLWKVYFDDLNNGIYDYEILHEGSVLMRVSPTTDCSGGFCTKTVDKCSSPYDDAIKTAYQVEPGTTNLTGVPSSSFANSCTYSGYGDDGWDNDCNRVFDNTEEMFINPTTLNFFRVDYDNINDTDADPVDFADNGQSCIWKVYFEDSNAGAYDYDIIHNGVPLMQLDYDTDCSGGSCMKWVDQCGLPYDDLVKTAHVVPGGTTSIIGKTSASFTNSCIISGSGADGLDNDCDGTFDETDTVYSTCYVSNMIGTTPGGAYSCPATANCGGDPAATLTGAVWGNSLFNYYDNATCTAPNSQGKTLYVSSYAITGPGSGTVPDCFSGDTYCGSGACSPNSGFFGYTAKAAGVWGQNDCRYSAGNLVVH